ncbi:hypothetical protein CBW58_18210 [Yersinia frederiksenii]|nr:hypothetical protein CBW58_18210 [Yersinia frederiksenii]
MKIIWGLVALCSAIGFFQGVFMVMGANSAPQQAAGAAMGIAWAVIPYCFAKAIQMMKPREVIIKTEN